MKWCKEKYKLRMDCGPYEVEGSVCGDWGIDKRENQYYILTHIPTGCRVESARTMKFLKDLVATPEFENFDGKNVEPLKVAIQRLRNINGWKA